MDVTRHKIVEQRIARALGDIEGRAFGRRHGLRYDRLSLAGLREMRDELLDHVAARALQDPALTAPRTAGSRASAPATYRTGYCAAHSRS
ncbi:hypothetical protein AB0H73_25520 [Streptomyces olivoreticuli]